MILAHIIAKNKKQALQIISVLLEEKLLLHAAISKKTVYKFNEKAMKLEKQKQTLIIGKTKGLLFNNINKEIKAHFSENMPMLYAVPIVYMDEELATILRASTAKVWSEYSLRFQTFKLSIWALFQSTGKRPFPC